MQQYEIPYLDAGLKRVAKLFECDWPEGAGYVLDLHKGNRGFKWHGVLGQSRPCPKCGQVVWHAVTVDNTRIYVPEHGPRKACPPGGKWFKVQLPPPLTMEERFIAQDVSPVFASTVMVMRHQGVPDEKPEGGFFKCQNRKARRSARSGSRSRP
jgi:hypothetical protein